MHKDDIKYIGSAQIDSAGCKGCGKQPLNSYDWLSGYADDIDRNKYVEVQFKNTRKVVFTNPLGLEVHKDDIVAVEGSPGVDIGRVVLTGTLAALRFRRQEAHSREPIRQLFRLATQSDLDRCEEAKRREHGTMIEARQIAEALGLEMKIGDVEYQGDGSKAIFYYIADGRVDFRKLIRVLAETFHVRIEMKQIGARQEAGRIGGIGPCGRPLCCAQWMTSFKSVNTAAARYQDLTLNPEKLTGQCAKLKCCTNFEVNTYVEAQKRMPPRDVVLETEEGSFYFFKWDLLKGEVTYTAEKNRSTNACTITTRRAREVIEVNRRGEKPATLLEERYIKKPVSLDILDENLLTRFDDKGRKRRKGNGNNNRGDRTSRSRNTGEKETVEGANPERNTPPKPKRETDTPLVEGGVSDRNLPREESVEEGRANNRRRFPGDRYSNSRRRSPQESREGEGSHLEIEGGARRERRTLRMSSNRLVGDRPINSEGESTARREHRPQRDTRSVRPGGEARLINKDTESHLE